MNMLKLNHITSLSRNFCIFRIKTPATIHQPNSSGPKLQMLPSEVTDIDQPLYDWGIENRMEQYYNAVPPQSHFAPMEEPAHQVKRPNILPRMHYSNF